MPQRAVTYVDGKPRVFLATGEDRARPVEVVLGPSDGALQAIASGVSEGQKVVVDGVFALKSELYR